MIASHNQPKVKRARASSARPSNQKARPLSGNSTKHVNKVDFIENMYGGLMTTKRLSNRNMPSKLGNGFGEDNEVSKLGYSKIFKQKQELLQENMQLKKQNHQLKEELSHQKGKTEQMRKKNSQYTKKLGIEFEKQMYWSGTNTNMVRGIKSQYETMKEKYEEKCREFDDMAKEFIYSQTREDKVYIEALINQNEKLMRRIDESFEELRHLQHGTLTSVVEESIEAYKTFKHEIQQHNQILSAELQQAKSKIKVLHRNLEERQKKISFLDRLLIQRDNAEHAARRKLKKVEKEKQDLLDEFTQFKKQKGDLLEFYENKHKKAKDNYEKQSETQRIIFRNELLDKADRITKLEKEIAYLTTLLSYWKPLDQINEIVTNKIVNNNNNNNNINNYNNSSEYEKQFVLQYSMNSTLIKYNGSKHNIRVPSQQHDEQYETKSIVSKSRKGSADQGYKNVSDVMTKSIDINKGLGQKKKRTQITAEKRNTQEGVKSRKVDIAEVADICETIKYRFIGLSIPIEQVRKYFDYQDEMEMVTSEQEEAWKKQYINMKQVKQILMNDDFGLSQNDAHLLSRFLVEDSQNEYVYCDPNNEHLRAVVKSIIKNIIGEYELPRNINTVIEHANDLLYKYQTNLESALKSTAPKGLISKKKLIELFKGLGIELTHELEDYFVGKIVIKSQNLNSLRYKVMFQK